MSDLLRSAWKRHRDTHDAVTGVWTHLTFMRHADRALHQEPPTSALLLLFSLENHADIVQHFGEDTADKLLQSLAQRLRASLPVPHEIGRVGAARFAVLCPELDLPSWTTLQRQLTMQLRAPQQVDQATLLMEVHAGAARFPSDGDNATQLLDSAAAMLARARAWRPSDYATHAGGASGAQRLKIGGDLVSELESAVEQRQLFLLYQPVLELHSQRVIGAEALVRWRHPVRGVIEPSVFVPIAEQTGAIRTLTTFVLQEAAEQLARWQRADIDLHLSINISARDLADRQFADDLADVLSATGVEASGLELELTEHAMSRDWDTSRRVLNHIRESGVGIAVDDFGTGYSSLAHLKDLHVDTLKLDRSFVHDLESSTPTVAIVRAVMALAAGLHARTLAEGIERAEVAKTLTDMGCQAGQGYYFAPPMNEAALHTWMGNHGLAAAAGL